MYDAKQCSKPNAITNGNGNSLLFTLPRTDGNDVNIVEAHRQPKTTAYFIKLNVFIVFENYMWTSGEWGKINPFGKL